MSSGILSRLRVGPRVTMTVVLPVVAMLGLSSYLIIEERNQLNQLEVLSALATMGVDLSGVVHQLQKERGRSAGFIASGGKTFAVELPTQRLETDKARKILDDRLKEFDAGPSEGELATRLTDVTAALAELESKRQQITDLKMSVPQMAKYYSGTIGKALDTIALLGRLSTDNEVTFQIAAYVDFLHVKERAGVERAMGAGGFGAGKFTVALGKRFVTQIAMQDAFLKEFSIHANQEQYDFYKRTVVGSPVEEVDRMREVAIVSIGKQDAGGVKTSHWFEQINAKINLMKEVENKVASDLISLTSAKSAEAQETFTLLLVVSLVVLVLVLGTVVTVSRSITRPIDTLTHDMGKLANGDKGITVQGTDRGDELGEMARAVLVFKENMIKADQLQAEEEQQQQ